MREAMDKQRLQQPLNEVERVTHTGETGKSTDTCVSSTIVNEKRMQVRGTLSMRTMHCSDRSLRAISTSVWKEHGLKE